MCSYWQGFIWLFIIICHIPYITVTCWKLLTDQSRVLFIDLSLSLHTPSIFQTYGFVISLLIARIGHILPEVCHAIICVFVLSCSQILPALLTIILRILIYIIARAWLFIWELFTRISRLSALNVTWPVTRSAPHRHSDLRLSTSPVYLRLSLSFLGIIGWFDSLGLSRLMYELLPVIWIAIIVEHAGLWLALCLNITNSWQIGGYLLSFIGIVMLTLHWSFVFLL